MRGPGADAGGPRRLGDLPDEPVPAVPPKAGPRVMVWISAAVGLFGLFFLVVTAISPAPLAKLAGLAHISTATVTAKEYREVVGGRGSCDFYRIEVEWADGSGFFTVCDNPDYSATRLEVGDRVEVASVPWSSEVTAEGTEGDLFWAVTSLVVGLWLTAMGFAWVRRFRRLLRGTASGPRLSGRATRTTRNAMRVLLDTPGLEGRQMTLLPAKRVFAVGEGDDVEIWASRRSWLGRRPRGPWVVRARGGLIAFTHGWLRRRG